MSVISLSSLFEDCKSLEICELRVDTGDYKEIVAFWADLPKWQKLFESRLGPAEKLLGAEPTDEQLQLTKKYGCIRKQQILFKGKEGVCRCLVMIWPWEDKEHITLKMALYP